MLIDTAVDQRVRPGATGLEQLRAVVLLGGSVRATNFNTGIERSVLDLPIEAGRSLLDHWQDAVAELARQVGAGPLALRVMIDQGALLPQSTGRRELVRLAVERDRGSYRGSGGVLYDLSLEHADDDLILVASAGQLYEESLVGLTCELAARAADVAIVSYDDGSPSGWMLVRCGALRRISPQGFVDMKEQALPAIARTHAVAVVHRPTAGAAQVRTTAGYIAALRRHFAGLHGASDLDDPYREQWRPEFSIVEEGATVSSAAALHDSVVLRGAVVNARAVLVRCLVCPGAVVPRGRTVMDQLIDMGGSWRGSKTR